MSTESSVLILCLFLPANQSPSYPSSGGEASCRAASVRPESFLFRLGQKEEKRKDAELVEQLRKNIEARLKVSLPSDLGAALTDGVVLCHLANHDRLCSVGEVLRGGGGVYGTVGVLLSMAPPLQAL
ncbi:Leucine-rich repeat and calponin y domain-containing protein 3 [Liparis tanakae]|uniref:Leucine-rich repeat and calponin y domain-containing protein 3 n=1 Tax=Liparis tanakae TaxID=230148 RepID=A0A4Z2E583_9TELE|nr:Leucine-rich repeat and calponin y domain-containing protein 3 [Liparis tanakae]